MAERLTEERLSVFAVFYDRPGELADVRFDFSREAIREIRSLRAELAVSEQALKSAIATIQLLQNQDSVMMLTASLEDVKAGRVCPN